MMPKILTILAVFFSAAAAIAITAAFFFTRTGSNSFFMFSNIAAGCVIKAVSLWINLENDSDRYNARTNFLTSTVFLIIAVLFAITMTWSGVIVVLCVGIAALVVFLFDLIVYFLAICFDLINKKLR